MSRFHSLPLLGLMLIGLMLGCDKVPLTSPTGSTITLTIDRATVPIGGTATLTAVVTESSGTAPHNGTMVTFVAPFGTVTPQEAPTVGGIARATYTATASGTAKVSAFSGAAKATEVELRVGGAAVEKVTVRTEPSSIPQTGGTVTVIAGATDASGSALPNTSIGFTVDQGSLSSSSALTDANGDARVTLTTNRTTKITASVAGKTAEFTITALAAPTVAISSCTATPAVGVAVNCTITPTVASGGSPIVNLTVNWGDNTGEQPLGGTGTTTASHTYSAPGTYTVTAAATDLNSQRGTGSTSIVVNRVLPTGTLTVPTTGTAGVAVAMSFAPPATPSQPISNVTIEFGDGSTRNLGAVTGSTGFTKTYGTEGGYTVTAVITDTSGQVGRVSQAIVISRGAAPSVTLTLTSGTAQVNQVESFTVTPTAGGSSIQNVRVTIDGVADPVYDRSSGGSFTYVFPTVNTYVMRATVTDAAGNTGNTILFVNVQ